MRASGENCVSAKAPSKCTIICVSVYAAFKPEFRLWADRTGRGCSNPHEIWLLLGEPHWVRFLLPSLSLSKDAEEDVLGAVSLPFHPES